MSSLNLYNRVVLISQIAISLTVLLANPAVSQDFGFLSYSQSRRFFDQGNQKFEQEIKLLEVNIKPVEIKFSQDLQQPQDLQESSSKSKLDLTSKKEELKL